MLGLVGARVAVFGHEIVTGYEAVGREQLILTSSFGAQDKDKRVVIVDLEATYTGAQDLREGHEIQPLYE